MQERMIRTFSLGERPGLDQPTSVCQRRRLVTMESCIGWSTNLLITKMEKVKINTLSHLYLFNFLSILHVIDGRSSSSSVTGDPRCYASVWHL